MSTVRPRTHRRLQPHRLDVDQETALLVELVAAEQELLDQLVACTGVRAPDGALPREERNRRIAELREQCREQPAVQAAWRRVNSLRWRLALSATDQLQYQLRRRRYVHIQRRELEQAGMLGLYEAARRFDPERSVRFGTYARWWVRAALGEVVCTLQSAMRLPRSARRDMRQLGEDALRDGQHRLGTLRALRDCVSFDGIGDEGRSWSEIVPARVDGPEDAAVRRDLLERLERARGTARLNERHRRILRLRYHEGRRGRSYRAIGEELSISGERVRQIEHQALDRLREAMAS